jgi:3-(methylthio)propanoyl-CoA dehydrogenase
MSYDIPVLSLLAHLQTLPRLDRLLDLLPDSAVDEAMLTEILGTAGTFAHDVLSPFNRVADRHGASLVEGRVKTAPGHGEVWSAFVEGGWTTIEAPVEFGGAGLPMIVHSACEELFNRASPAFGMLATPIRCAVRLLTKYANADLQSEWLPKLVAGEWGATICISEADAGSDVPRLRTRARPRDDGSWSVSGEKMWISFGDHDLTERIGHLVLARTPEAPVGAGGLSLFLVPSTVDGRRNGVHVRRLEEKLGLHGSPTCELGFEDAQGWMIGTQHRGLSQLFTMIIGMRLSVGSQGAGIAGASADLAWAYAAERKQGGRPDQAPVAIDNHGDVQRTLLACGARAEVARGLVLVASIISDLQALETDAGAKGQAADLLGWLLPITKNFGAEAASLCASEAIQVLGGAGYTREWPAEQYLRDARVLAIYEGTSGMQALDLLMRRVLGDEGRCYRAFLQRARADVDEAADAWAGRQLTQVLDCLGEATDHVARFGKDVQFCQSIAYPYLQLASIATTGWVALRLTALAGSPVKDRIAALARHWLRLLPAMAGKEGADIAAGCDLTCEFANARSGIAT